MDKSWMDAPRHTQEYLQGLARFLGYAFAKSSVENKIFCPCKNCVNAYWREERIVREHLVCVGFLEGYKQWMFHGERASSSVNPPNFYDAEDRDEGDDISDLLRDLAGGLDDRGDFEDDGSTDQDNSFLESLHKLESLIYWRSPEFEARSDTAKENRAKSTMRHTAGSKSHARVTQEMADELGYTPRRDEVFIRTHTLKKGPNKGQHVAQAALVISELLRAADDHPDWKEKSLKEGDLFARVCGMKEPRGHVRVLGLGPTPQDMGTPGTRGKVSTRALVEMVARREAEHRISTLEEQMQQMLQQMNQMKEMQQGGHNLEAPSSQHGSTSRHNSRAEIEEEIDGEEGNEEDGEDDYVHRRFVANPKKLFNPPR